MVPEKQIASSRISIKFSRFLLKFSKNYHFSLSSSLVNENQSAQTIKTAEPLKVENGGSYTVTTPWIEPCSYLEPSNKLETPRILTAKEASQGRLLSMDYGLKIDVLKSFVAFIKA